MLAAEHNSRQNYDSASSKKKWIAKEIRLWILGILSMPLVGLFLLQTCRQPSPERGGVHARRYAGAEVNVGNRSWCTQNLNVIRYTDDAEIPRAMSMQEWKKYNEDSIGCYCDFGTGVIYYNFFAAFDKKHGGLMPHGFQLPAINDVQNIRNSGVFAPAVKTNLGWRTRRNGDFGGGEDRTGLNISPTGYVTPDFRLIGRDSVATFWLSDPADVDRDVDGHHTRYFFMHIESETDSISWDHQSMNCGYAIRPVRMH